MVCVIRRGLRLILSEAIVCLLIESGNVYISVNFSALGFRCGCPCTGFAQMKLRWCVMRGRSAQQVREDTANASLERRYARAEYTAVEFRACPDGGQRILVCNIGRLRNDVERLKTEDRDNTSSVLC
jgi:hypothetical protein